MTGQELLARGRAAARSWWALPLLLVLVAMVLAWRLDAGRRAEADRARLAEEARLRAEGLLVVEQVRSKDLAAEARRLAGENTDLAAELARARRAAPGAVVVATVSARTGPRPASGSARPGPACPAPTPPIEGQPPSPIIPKTIPPEPACPLDVVGPLTGRCLLEAGDLVEIRVDQVELETREGARVVVGAAAVWRLGPGAEERLASGGFQAPLSAAKEPARPPPPGWGAGLYAGLSREGWALGPALALPPARLWGLQGEVVVGVGVGPNGAWQGSGAALVRW